MQNAVLFVDDDKSILSSLVRLLRKEGYNILTAESGMEGISLLKSNSPAVVVSDYRMPGMDGVEFLAKIKEISPDTVRLMLTGYADLNAIVAAINKGEVYRYITKPWNDDEIKQTIKAALIHFALVAENKRLNDLTRKQNEELRALNAGLEARVAEKTRKIRENFFSFVRIFADMMELYDRNVGGHSKRVAAMARAMSSKMGLDGKEVDLIETAALLHNIGLIGVPREIIDKNEESLNEREKALLRHNPVLSQDLISSIDTLRQAGTIIRSHMERYDGKGYPDGFKKEEVHVGAGIIAVCKLYDNLMHMEKGLNRLSVMETIKAEKGKMLSPVIADAFMTFIRDWKEENVPVAAAAVGGIKALDSMLHLKDLRPGMVLVKDILTGKGRLLVPKGTTMTNALIEKVLNFHQLDPVIETVRVVVP